MVAPFDEEMIPSCVDKDVGLRRHQLHQLPRESLISELQSAEFGWVGWAGLHIRGVGHRYAAALGKCQEKEADEAREK
jgi:hypothetical protein